MKKINKPPYDPVRITDLRSCLKKNKVHGFLIPQTDEYLGEYVPECAERLLWLTNFSGSAGIAIILQEKAAIFTDSRYTIQIKQEVNRSYLECFDYTDMSPEEWCAQNLGQKQVLGYDPKLHTSSEIERFETALAPQKITLKPLVEHLVDSIWEDRPDEPETPVEIFPESYAGKTSAEKRSDICAQLKRQNIYAAIITQTDSIAWLLNIRASDISHIPVALSYAILYTEEGHVDWFIKQDRIGKSVQAKLDNKIQILPPSIIDMTFDQLVEKSNRQDAKIQIDNKRSPIWFEQLLHEYNANIHYGDDPCILPRACKTDNEIKSMKNVHIHDGIAVVRFLIWLEETIKSGTPVTEMDAAQKIDELRAQDKTFRDTSFDTISGFGPNGAIVHYRVTEDTNRQLEKGNLLLVDSGGQYKNGTTDITRTIPIGTPEKDMIDNYTLVLKGHIQLARTKFPSGTTGAQLDTLARKPLWKHGIDYLHGTGHGVGCYLSVHEEAASISPRGQKPLKPGMILSNEPGYYKEDHYGIRIENLVVVIEAKGEMDDGRPILAFDTITLAPINTSLINVTLLSQDEKRWLNNYHKNVFLKLSSFLEDKKKIWLEKATAPI